MKTIYAFLLFVAIHFGVISINVYAQVPTAGLVGYFPFNGNVNDESGQSNNGTLSGASLTQDRFGATNKSYSFNGINNYISLKTYDIQPRTLSIWFNAATADYSNWVNVLSSDNPKLTKGLLVIGLKQINGSVKMQLNACNAWDTFNIALNVWHNVSICTGADSAVKFYLDGKLVYDKKYSKHLTSVDGTDKLLLGTTRSQDKFFKGMIDDVRIYNRVLTPAEIESIYYDNYCVKHISVTDTLIISMNMTGFNPLTFKHNLKFYPNPTKNKLNIDCGGDYNALKDHTIRITNSTGSVMFTNKISQQTFQMDLSSWSGSGLYLIYILDSQGTIVDVRKIILQ